MKLPTTPIHLPPLPYSYDGWEPIINSRAMKIHYDGHHRGYVETFNRLLKEGGSREDLEFNYSGHVLHSNLWDSYGPIATRPGPMTVKLVTDKYKSHYPLEEFLKEMIDVASKIKGSGWSIALVNKGKLKIVSIANHDLHDVIHADPLLLIDSWEHQYYLQYTNKKKEFFNGIIDLVNWNTVETRLQQSNLRS